MFATAGCVSLCFLVVRSSGSSKSEHAEEVERARLATFAVFWSITALSKRRCNPPILQGPEKSIKTAILTITTHVSDACTSGQTTSLAQRLVIVSH
jgi:hypothetical protein